VSFRTSLNGEVEVEAEAETIRDIPGEAIRKNKYKQLVSILKGVISNVYLYNNEVVYLLYRLINRYL
jgi:hypothetical protein